MPAKKKRQSLLHGVAAKPFRKERKPKIHKHKSAPGKVGRPRRDIDWQMVRRLARIHCTPQEIAMVLKVPWQTLVHREEFREYYGRGWAKGNISLRRVQYQVALEGNPQMLMFLGRQNLGQTSGEESRSKEDPLTKELAVRNNIQILSTEELETLHRLLEKAREGGKIIDVQLETIKKD